MRNTRKSAAVPGRPLSRNSMRISAVMTACLLAVLLAAVTGAAGTLWTANGVAVCTNASAQDQPVVAPDGSGGAFVVWEDSRFDAMKGTDVYAQHLSSTGARMWGSDVVVSDVGAGTDQTEPCIAADGEGGFYAAWVDQRNETGGNTAGDIFATRIDADGGFHTGWTDGGTLVSEDPVDNYTHDAPCICTVPTGGAVIAFEWYTGTTGTDIFAQRMDASGGAVWTANGVALNDTNLNQTNPAICWASGGSQPGPIVGWVDENLGVKDIYAMKLKFSDGSPANASWLADGNQVKDDSSGGDYVQQDVRVVADGSGGAIFAWESAGATDWGVFAQKLDEDGAIQWAGDQVCDAANDQLDPAIVGDGSGGAIIAWEDLRDDAGDIYVQRVNSGGTLQWGPSPKGIHGVDVATSTSTQVDPVVAEDGNSGAFIAWEDNRSGNVDVFAQMVSNLGLMEYQDDGEPVAVAANSQDALAVASGGADKALLCWEDDRTDPDQDIYTLALSGAGPDATSISPATGENTGAVSVTNLAGSGFDTSGMTIKLKKTGETDITATGVNVVSSTKVTCAVDLTGAAEGAWDVYVENELDSENDTLAGAFTVTAPEPVPTTYPTWYLAEGSTAWGFDAYVNIENPNATQCTARVTYMTSIGAVSGPDTVLPPMSQTIISPRETLGEADFSTLVECLEGKTIAVDRTMVWQASEESCPEAHSSVGVTSPATTWYLPEGSSNWGFECFLLIQNPNAADATCTVTYMIQGEGPLDFSYVIPAFSRRTFNMADFIGSKDASIRVVSDQPVIPERAMYRNGRREGHDSIGTTMPARDYFLAEGATAWGFTTFVLIQNPNEASATVTITYMTPGGALVQSPFSMGANSRTTIKVNDYAPDKDLSTWVHSDQPIIAERAMYWDYGAGEACHDSIGLDSAHSTFYFPDGASIAADVESGTVDVETWTLVQNPNGVDVTVRISYLTPTGTSNVTFEDVVPANSRKSYNMGDRLPDGTASVMVECLTAGRKIMAERAMYAFSRGLGTDTIGGYSD